MRYLRNDAGQYMDDFDDASVRRIALATDDSPIWGDYPYTKQQKDLARTQARFLLRERAAGRAKLGTLRDTRLCTGKA